MGVYSAKTLVMGCVLANILTIAGVKESGRPFTIETPRDDVGAPYCQFKGTCWLEPSTVQAQFIEAEPTTDDPTQTVSACNGSGDRPAPQHGQRKALGVLTTVSA